MHVLLTNDDGIQATGLNALRRALLEVPGLELSVIAPDSNRSATARSITTRKPLWVDEIEFGDGTTGYATDGTPVDCVRFAALGLIGVQPDLIVSGINHGSNLGDDITYSGTVAAALEGIVLGHPGDRRLPAVAGGESTSARPRVRLREGGAFAARLVEELERPDPGGHAAQHQLPAATRAAPRLPARQAHLPRPARARPRRSGGPPHATGSTAAIRPTTQRRHRLRRDRRRPIAVTPLHFDLTDRGGVEELDGFDLRLLGRPAPPRGR